MFLSCHVICGLAFCLFFYVNMCASVTQTGHQMAMFVAQSADALTPYAHQQHVCPGSSLFVGRPVGRSVQESYITSLSPFLVRSYELWRIITSWKHILVLGVCGLIKWNLIYMGCSDDLKWRTNPYGENKSRTTQQIGRSHKVLNFKTCILLN